MSLIKVSHTKNMLIGLLIICILIMISQMSWESFKSLDEMFTSTSSDPVTSTSTPISPTSSEPISSNTISPASSAPMISASSAPISPVLVLVNKQIVTIDEVITAFNAKSQKTPSETADYLTFLKTQLVDLTKYNDDYNKVSRKYDTYTLTELEQETVDRIQNNINKECNSSTSTACDDARNQTLPPRIQSKITSGILMRSALELADTIRIMITPIITKINDEIDINETKN